MTDTFKSHARSLTAPPESAAAILPSDSERLKTITRALYVGQAGDLTVRMRDGTEVTFANVAVGSFLPLRVTQVLASGTSAGGIVGLW